MEGDKKLCKASLVAQSLGHAASTLALSIGMDQHGMDMDRSFCTPKKTGPVHREKNLLCSHCHTAAIAEPTCLIAHLLAPHDRAFSPPLYNIQQLKAMAQLHGVNDGKPTGASNGTRERGGGTKRDSFCTHVGNLSWSMPMDRARVDAV